MKEKKLYKIAFMGDKDHGCDIISTLESWGGSNHYLRTGSDPEYVYFINVLGVIDVLHNSKMLSKGMENFYFLFWHDYNIECHLKVGESINYGGQDYDVDSILFDANNRCIVYKLKSFGIGVEYITNNELTPTEKYQTEEENNEYLTKNNMKTKLAIKGHPTRNKEVIKLLKILGGKPSNDCECNNPNIFYYILDEYISWDYIGLEEIDKYKIFTLDEFLEKYPFKLGDKVFDIAVGNTGTIVDVKWDEDVSDMKYRVAFDNGDMGWFTIDTFGFLKEDKNLEEEKMSDKNHKIGHTLVPNKIDDKLEYKIPDDYEFDVVVDGKIILKSIKPKYPTTYEECCGVLKIPNDERYIDIDVPLDYNKLLSTFTKILMCRKAYWKLAGEEMGLDKPWDSVYGCGEWGYWIGYDINANKIYCQDSRILLNHLLVFPNEEMRDAFYENFKDLIEQCKELL